MRKTFLFLFFLLFSFCGPTEEELLTQECNKTKQELFQALDYWKDNYEFKDFKEDYELYDEYRVDLLTAIESAFYYELTCEELDGYWDLHFMNSSVDFWQSRVSYLDGYWEAKEKYNK